MTTTKAECREPTLDSLKCLLLDIAQQRSLNDLLWLIVRRLADRPTVVLARIWLLKPGDICSTCRFKEECPDQRQCLHLVASAGRSGGGDKTEWMKTDGYFARFPLGVCKVGRIGKTGEQLVINEMEHNLAWIARPDWARQEGIQGFHGQPIIYKGETLGVLAVFEREPVTNEATVWFRMIADHVAVAIANARAFEEIERLKAQLELENTFLKEEVLEAQNFGDIIGQSPAIANLVQQIELVAPTDATALISGESGTGKELVAREIHRRSQRKDHPLVRVNCASIPKDLYESEFFGHAKGSFTGAMKDRAGRFQAADGGTLFLDEVGEIPLEMQSKLLRVLQEGEYERVGEETTRKVNVRIIAATNRKLAQEVEAKRFRQDLYYRLNVFPIEVAPLRNRKEDIPLLAGMFMANVRKKLNCTGRELTQAEVVKLQNYHWPGNVRELQNIIERAVISSRCGSVKFDLPVPQASGASLKTPIKKTGDSAGRILTEEDIRLQEKGNIEAALLKTGWKIYGTGGAAELLGIKPTTLLSRIKKMGIEKAH
ncbi:sigma-54-dependent Fis family transcriptional regulator [Candidatus Nitrospira allomarina]|uniref:Sigma 54-interacting transcriptional regulator n=1 Tax=Candidatus Nitrospira allomarina TaxID=3020900 RepID=A0AA96GJS7_9BACT|nr:sigma 54-interacting transcriptional regulator [Candidatus Nitrospira allomarina]WNM58916.1 sigma 54-interacting transcriptional regulator [Candidatus Nitrospira allomarina]